MTRQTLAARPFDLKLDPNVLSTLLGFGNGSKQFRHERLEISEPI
jgi:hypothetical protein